MEERKIETIYKVYGYDELTAEDRELVDAAKQMTQTSFAPYSKFHVGAAIRMDNGNIVLGSNQENAAFPSSLCAERTACFQASLSGHAYAENSNRCLDTSAPAGRDTSRIMFPEETYKSVRFMPSGTSRIRGRLRSHRGAALRTRRDSRASLNSLAAPALLHHFLI